GARAPAETNTETTSANSPVVEKPAAPGSKVADGGATAFTRTPRFTVWLSGSRSRSGTVQVEVIHKHWTMKARRERYPNWTAEGNQCAGLPFAATRQGAGNGYLDNGRWMAPKRLLRLRP